MSFRLLTDPSEANFAAYSIRTNETSVLGPTVGTPRWASGALLRALLINARECGGVGAIDDLSATVVFSIAAGMSCAAVREATPLPYNRTPVCGRCGQWGREHRHPNVTSCDRFTIEPRPGTAANPMCRECHQPLTHHGSRYTVACPIFRQ